MLCSNINLKFGKCVKLQVDLLDYVLKSNFLLCDLNSLLMYLIKIIM